MRGPTAHEVLGPLTILKKDGFYWCAHCGHRLKRDPEAKPTGRVQAHSHE